MFEKVTSFTSNMCSKLLEAKVKFLYMFEPQDSINEIFLLSQKLTRNAFEKLTTKSLLWKHTDSMKPLVNERHVDLSHLL